ncbi:MAG TPA: hypothetical protein VHX38_27035 [Pseudonocardiaceae bacterium]|jgi:hypothetical protein|nr:hypothetical protein [Pseudonocardiaceae bacterium]
MGDWFEGSGAPAGPARATTDPNAAVSAADQPAVKEIQTEQTQVVMSTIGEVASGLGGLPTSPGSGGAGSGFSFSPEEIATQISQCQQLIKNLNSDQRDIDVIAGTKPPATDEAGSVHQANAVVKFGNDLRVRNRSQIGYLEGWIATLQKAQQNYMETEHLTQAQWNRLTLGLDA